MYLLSFLLAVSFALAAAASTAARHNSGWDRLAEHNSKRAKARQNTVGVDTDRSRGHKVRGTAELDIERPVVGTVELEAALEQAKRWIEQWDKLVWDRSNGHLLRPTPAHSARGRGRQVVDKTQGAWCKRQLRDSGVTVWTEAGWGQHFEMQKYRRSNKEPD